MRTGTNRLVKHANLKGWLFCIQAVIAVAITIGYPFVYSFVLSLTDVKLSLSNLNFIGFENYAWVFRPESRFFKALWVSVSFSVVSTLVQTVLGFLVAVMLYFMTGKLQSFYKVTLYLPVILPGALVSAMWILMYRGDEFGVFNMILGLTDPPHQWMGEYWGSFFAIVATNTWRYLGTTMIIYLVNMNSVSRDVVESAQLDGASRARIMMRIIFPLTWSATTTNILLSLIGGMKSFDLFFLFQQNGNLSTELTPVSVLIYRIGLGNRDVFNINLSRSVTLSIVLAIFLSVFTGVVNLGLGRKKEEDL